MWSFKRLRPLALFIAGLTVVLVAVWFGRLRSTPPADLDALEAGVRPLGLTPVRVGRFAVYLCDHPRDLAELHRLVRAPEGASEWVGVVYADYAPPVDALDDRTTHDWGRFGLRVGDWVFFGGPGLLAKIRDQFAR